MQYVIIAVVILGTIVVGVGCSRRSGGQAVQAPGISSGRVEVQRYEVTAGDTGDGLIRDGLTTLTGKLAATIKPGDSLQGVFDGTVHLESDGTIRMFAMKTKAVEGEASGEFMDGVVPLMFGCKFPPMGQDVLLYVAFEITGKD